MKKISQLKEDIHPSHLKISLALMEAGSVAQHTKFQVLCDLCEKVSLKSSKEERNKLVEKFINRWREGHSKLHKDDQTSDSIYPALRLLLPKLEKERPAYGVKEIRLMDLSKDPLQGYGEVARSFVCTHIMLAKLYIDVLCLSKNSQEAQKLLNFKNPRNAHAMVTMLLPKCHTLQYNLVNSTHPNSTLDDNSTMFRCPDLRPIK
ncbi:LIG4 [Cordylochernes scorpioides]|uniref:LIG4 n=1 Tax=Cordylochernes scorpioides TaxID=51811 RepID=A0ABY6LS16_9ARAC|nr:LIG4 [Cordylochernes scorpioides]